MTRLRLLAGSANVDLAGAMGGILDAPRVPVAVERFPDGELSVRLGAPVRACTAVVVQPTCPPVERNLVELLAIADACRRAASARIVAVVPYFGYARGDRRQRRREPIMASLVARLMESAGIDHVIAVDLHAPQIEGFFHVPVEDLDVVPVLLEAIRPALPGDVVVVSPDLGRLGLATRIADELDTDAAVIHKRRVSGREVRSAGVIGEVRGRSCLIVDDMISTGGTIRTAVDALLRAGAREDILVAATHGLFVEGAAASLACAAIRGIWVTDSIPQAASPPHRVVTIAPMLASAAARLAGPADAVDGSAR
jgi:ribose-phosphate pyrophosphokinase